MEIQEQLKQKLHAEYDAYISHLKTLDKAEIIARADLISAKEAIVSFVDENPISDSDVAYLLSIKNPLSQIMDSLLVNVNQYVETEYAIREVNEYGLGELIDEEYGEEYDEKDFDEYDEEL